LGSFDTSGSPDLAGDGNKVSDKFKAGISGHKGITLTAAEIDASKVFLNSK
jgi:hypothetical protein